ncbi:hypothetical protein [Engelhardtia mirabilis]|uniref:DUF4168 domain-containing protein n=1 Tax=Engelhardtia mirabilis TaxID=2528011 RepID=A0A518BMH0_9BACT|nr:hypothetical protein Pla133_32650 [Planctomycetes bacterium Pla133]QDV02497.1 hypothetical protein Pla86_32640 [Planctomycetes bacterium Pla86]
MRATALALFALTLAAGCASIEGSSESAADSSAGLVEALVSPFESSSTSSGSGGTAAGVSYQQDVQAFVCSYLSAPSEPGDFARGLTQVAQAHGVSDWESQPGTFEVIEASVSDPALDSESRARLELELEALGRRD